MKKNIESTIEALVQPIVDAKNIEIVDIEYVKEAGQFYLRIYLEKEGGSGDKNKIRHCLFCCSASRPATESSTIEDEKEVKTETLSLTATALNSGLLKTKTCEKTDAEVYEDWYKAVYMPNLAAAVQSGKASAASVKA